MHVKGRRSFALREFAIPILFRDILYQAFCKKITQNLKSLVPGTNTSAGNWSLCVWLRA
jgi:hypothetical protein